MFSAGLSSGARDGSRIRVMFLRHLEGGGRVPSGAIAEQDRVGLLGDMAAHLVEMELHGFGVGEGQDQRRAGAARRADRAEQVGAFVTPVGRLALTCSRTDADLSGPATVPGDNNGCSKGLRSNSVTGSLAPRQNRSPCRPHPPYPFHPFGCAARMETQWN